ncbi:ATP-binding cassette domain-containing protein [Actinomyces radicidentis]|uniref:ATP-binding cassette domain-containing protein n=1 Tax=Actinomyces radicidentis TaxID=111015 RepID=UPI0028E2CF6B|nr:ATP-binding cassette domain-containing protein [Actinomyces radicidentis]
MPPTSLVVRSLSAHSPAEPRTFTAPFTVGRTPDCDVQVVHPLVSRRHLLVTPGPQGWLVKCQGRNGMLVNGRATRSALITEGTRVQLGDASGPGLALMPVMTTTAPDPQPGGTQPGGEQRQAAGPQAPQAHRPAAYGTTPGAPSAPAAGYGGAPSSATASEAPSSASAAAPSVPSAAQPHASAVARATPSAPASYGSGPTSAPSSGSAAAPSAPSAPVPAQSASVPATQQVPLAAASAESARPLLAESAPSASTGGFPAGARRTVRSVRITASGTIGRHPDNALVLADPLVSGRHARVDLTAQGIRVTDLRSTNGMYVAGRKVQDVLVTEPTVIGMGSTFVSIRPDGLCEVQVADAGGELVGRDLTFSVNNGRLRLLDGISFSLPGHELLAVVGPSGAGKSTLLKALTGEQKAQEGQVLFNGLDVYENYPVMRNKIGVVPQNDVVHSALTVRQTLEYAAELRFAKDVTAAERRERINQVLEDLDLADHVDKRVKKLSGGQRKRVSTAIELLTSPSLLFLDEPTSGLDPQLDRDVMDLLATLAHGTRPGDTGRTVMVVTHNENHIDRADKVLILAAGGKPVYYGAPSQVLPSFKERLSELAAAGRVKHVAERGGFADPPAIEGFADVYALIRNHTEELRAHLEATVPSTRRGNGQKVRTSRPVTERQEPKQSALRQVSTLVRRHLRIAAADPSYLAFMLVLPLIMGVLTKAIEGPDGFSAPPVQVIQPGEVPRLPSMQALELLVILITGAAFSGMAATIRELVGERDVFLREKAVGLRDGAYLVAKTVVLALIVTVQTALMVGVALLLNPGPDDALWAGSGGLELALCCWAVAFVSGLLGLAVSAFVSSSEQVMPVLVVIIMAQLVLAGGVIPIEGRPGFEQLSWLLPARWGYAMASATVDMNTILPDRADGLWDHTTSQWWFDVTMLAAIGVVCFGACWVGLARRGHR